MSRLHFVVTSQEFLSEAGAVTAMQDLQESCSLVQVALLQSILLFSPGFDLDITSNYLTRSLNR